MLKVSRVLSSKHPGETTSDTEVLPIVHRMDGTTDSAGLECGSLIIRLCTLWRDELITSLITKLRLTDPTVVAITCDMLGGGIELEVVLVV